MLAGIYHSRGVIVWEGKSWCWARLHRLGNGNRAGSFSHRGPQFAAPPCDALTYLGYDGAASVALDDCSGLRSKTFLHSVVFSIQGFDQESLGLVFFFVDLFVLGTRTLHKGGVMICWLGRLGRCGGARDHASFCLSYGVCFGCVLGHFIVALQFHLR